MKLSQAIREGSKQTIKGVGTYFPGISYGETMACVLGAAWVGVHGLSNLGECHYMALAELWPELKQEYTSPGGTKGELWVLITTLNDSGRTREEIADWLESEEL